MSSKKLISFVFPVFNEAGNLPALYLALQPMLNELAFEAELLFVNDGSQDDSLLLLQGLQASDSRIKIIDLSRNFGHQIAVTAGLDAALGLAVIVMDADLQDPPLVCLELVAKWQEGNEVVYAQRRTRNDGFFKRASASFFYRTLRKLSDIDIPVDTGDFRLLDRRVVDEIKKFKEHNRFLRGMYSYVGFRQAAVQFDRAARLNGDSGYPLKQMIKLASDGILGFSTYPLKVISRIGVTASLVALGGIIYVLFMKVFLPQYVVEGWSFIVIAVLFMGGLNLFMLGIVGSYIGRIYAESQNRPLYIVRKSYSRTEGIES